MVFHHVFKKMFNKVISFSQVCDFEGHQLMIRRWPKRPLTACFMLLGCNRMQRQICSDMLSARLGFDYV